MSEKSPYITCTPAEAAFLASLLGAHTLLGLSDPFHGWLADEIGEAWERARTTLAERRYLEVAAEENLVIDTMVAALIGTWAFSQASFLLTVTRFDRTARYAFHLTRHLGVEQIEEDPSQVRLTALRDAAAVHQRIVELLGLQEQAAAASRPAAMPATALFEARAAALASGCEGAREVLAQAGVDPEIARALAETMADPRANAALVALVPRVAAWEVGGLGVLEGRNGQWRLRRYSRGSEEWVEAIPCAADEMRHEVRRLMNRVLPEPLSVE